MASSQAPVFLLGIFVLGYCHSILSLKAGHCAVHGTASQSKLINRFMCFFVSDFIGTFSTDVGYNIHIKCHHPHTNIIGLGDSSTWRAPFVPTLLYMLVTPLLLPILTPLVSIKELLPEGPFKMVRYLLIAGAGLTCHLYLLTYVSNLTPGSAFLVVFVSRNILSIPYIHVNIFQHIGLPMYSQKQRPVRLYQMYSGVLNLPRNAFLDYCFGHGIISCHVEHHLFPQLSDNMCLKIKPIVSSFCKEHGLPYHEDSYIGRTRHFIKNYEELMVNAPPITSFVGLQWMWYRCLICDLFSNNGPYFVAGLIQVYDKVKTPVDLDR